MAQFQGELHVPSDVGEQILRGRPCELSAYSYIPISRTETPKERTYFNTDKEDRYSHSTYDRLYHTKYNFNNKLHRCDREHAKSRGLEVNKEEVLKDVPVLASGEYGHRLERQCDMSDRKHVRIALIQKEFYSRRDINMKPPQETKDL